MNQQSGAEPGSQAARRPRISFARKAGYAVVVLLLVFAGLEALLRIAYFNLVSSEPLACVTAFRVAQERIQRARVQATDGSAADKRRHAPEYKGVDWANAYWNEFSASYRTAWMPFVDWRRRPFAGRYINVDTAGIRKTLEPSHQAQHVVWAFGGSTMWGTGVTDDWTIPSCMVRECDMPGRAIRVINMGESGWTGSQGLVYLQQRLKQGDRPDAVILYCGVNVVSAAFDARVAGVPKKALARVGKGGAGSRVHIGQPIESLAELADDISGEFLGNTRFLKQLGAAFGFTTLSVWQPILPIDKPLVDDYERRVAADVSADHVTLYRLTRDRIRQTVMSGEFADLSDIFQGTEEPIFIDYCHVGRTRQRGHRAQAGGTDRAHLAQVRARTRH